mmetsp:Transcript_115218/g.326453  ORF Transcript_115218/g.326453 Transcript_115218/m.326453 type:complete len:489 (+) Transcript_115218:82-1548(+)
MAPRTAIIFEGSRGDCEPYLVAGLFLKRAGWEVLLVGASDCVGWAEELGLAFFTYLPSAFEVVTDPEMVKYCTNNDVVKITERSNTFKQASFPAAVARLATKLREFKPDILLSGAPYTSLDVMALANILGVASLEMFSQPLVASNYTGALGIMPFFPPWTGINRRLWVLLAKKAIYEPQTKDHAPILESAAAGMKKKEFWPTWEHFDHRRHDERLPFPVLLLCSKVLLPPKPDYPDGFTYLGNLAMPDDCQKGLFFGGAKLDRMEEFLQAGEPPVYVGFGSIVCRSGKFMTLLSLRALMLSGERGILAAGWAGMGLSHVEGEPDEAELRRYAEERVLFMDTSPHGRLFPRCKAVVTHGGVGTFHASAKSGRPSVVVPIIVDQFNHADAVNELGIGVGLRRMKTATPKQLAAAITKCATSEAIQRKAAALGLQIREESEASGARFVEELDRYYREEVCTGRHRAKVEAMGKQYPWPAASSGGCLSGLCA